tara:strand:- start:98 stop:325 length:228 start_codon:yes stop_codon:yes gene_type:complete
MSNTYNLNILNNSFNLGNKKMMTMDDANKTMGDMGTSPRAIRSLYNEASTAFSVIPNTKIPDLSESRREEREERL